MQLLLHSKKLMAILAAGGFLLSLGISQAVAQTDTGAVKKVIQGVDQMMIGKQMLMEALQKQMLEKDPKLQNGIKLMNEGEQLAVTGKSLMKEKSESGKIKGKDEMEGKDEIMNELRARGMIQKGSLLPADTDLMNGENTMLDGKSMMMDGFKNISWD
ncbi:MAG: hypothetical protein P8X90_28255 [Desulfobacterales bacterium]